MGVKEKPQEAPNLSEIMFPLVDRVQEVVLDTQEIVSVADIIDTEIPYTLDSLEEKDRLKKQFELQVKGHIKRPTKKPQRRPEKGALKSRAKALREGLKPEVLSDGVDLWLNPVGRVEEGVRMNVFIAPQDMFRIRETVRVSNLDLDIPTEDPEVIAVLNEDQALYEPVLTYQEPNILEPRLMGEAIHFVEKPVIQLDWE